MVADVGDRADRDDLPRRRRPPSAHACHDAVALGDLDQRYASGLGDLGVIGVPDDGRQCAVDVQQDGGPGRIDPQGLQRFGERSGGGHDF